MLKILILEDEEPAAKRLLKMIREIEPDIELCASIVSVTTAIKWLKENEQPDLVFSDIQLSDGLSFEIFKEVNISCPVIFVTAFDQYALEAFKVNSIDYLLKPIKKQELENAFAKYRSFMPKHDHKTNENKDDMQLPFKTMDIHLAAQAIVVPLFSFRSELPTKAYQKYVYSYTSRFIPDTPANSLFRPPIM